MNELVTCKRDKIDDVLTEDIRQLRMISGEPLVNLVVEHDSVAIRRDRTSTRAIRWLQATVYGSRYLNYEIMRM
ncbi:MAG: hypothetical protein NZM00_12355 [Anaerolinea sp.]|nr:hypothetical protein [Anaerolinea sp.]